jgi:hypothetical protein
MFSDAYLAKHWDGIVPIVTTTADSEDANFAAI